MIIAIIGTAVAGANGAWSYDLGALSDGVHSLSAIAVDRAGNSSGPSPSLRLTIDTAAPPAPPAPGLLAADDSGVIGDGITNVPSRSAGRASCCGGPWSRNAHFAPR